MSKKKRVLGVGIVTMLCLAVGSCMFYRHQQEAKERNRQYEVSLVKALKNSYEGIEEIEITDPEYTSPPGAWHVKLN